MILNFNPHGTYHVGPNIYLNKTEAAYQASVQGKPYTWDFHGSTYSKFDWTKRPPGTLKEHYKNRAQQLRDSYDHIIIPFSGGMDSWTVLHSFLSNNLHVDEIWTNWPLKQMKYQQVNDLDRNEINFFSEFKYAVMPVLEYVKKNFPKTNIVINDYSSVYQNDFDENNIRLVTSWQNMSAPQRSHGQSEMCALALKHNKRVARVYGFDKTKIRVVDNKFYAFFTDTFGSGNIPTGEVSEFFYHSPNAPLIPILQAHCLKDELMNRKMHPVITSTKQYRGVFHSLYLNACCPDYPKDTFQTSKPLGTLIRASDFWVKDYNPRFYDSWSWAYSQYFNRLDDKFLHTVDNTVVGLRDCSSSNYLVDDNFNHQNFEYADPLTLKEV